MKQVASLQYDVIFKKAFSVPRVFSDFVSAILGKPVTFDRVETEKRFKKPIGHIDPRFDLYAENVEQDIIVDIQNVRYSDHYHRFLYYHCAALLNSVPHSRNYRPGVEIFTIVVLTSGDKHQRARTIIHFDPVDDNGSFIGEIPHKVIFLCPKYVTENVSEPVKSWLRAIEDTLDEEVNEQGYDTTIQQIFGLIQKDQITPAERARLKDEFSQQELLTEAHQQREEAQRVAEEERRLREEAQAELAALRAQMQRLNGDNGDNTND
jgi:hypothetical protein